MTHFNNELCAHFLTVVEPTFTRKGIMIYLVEWDTFEPSESDLDLGLFFVHLCAEHLRQCLQPN